MHKYIPVWGFEIYIHRHYYQKKNVCKVESCVSTDVIHISFSTWVIIFKEKKTLETVF